MQEFSKGEKLGGIKCEFQLPVPELLKVSDSHSSASRPTERKREGYL